MDEISEAIRLECEIAAEIDPLEEWPLEEEFSISQLELSEIAEDRLLLCPYCRCANGLAVLSPPHDPPLLLPVGCPICISSQVGGRRQSMDAIIARGALRYLEMCAIRWNCINCVIGWPGPSAGA